MNLSGCVIGSSTIFGQNEVKVTNRSNMVKKGGDIHINGYPLSSV